MADDYSKFNVVIENRPETADEIAHSCFGVCVEDLIAEIIENKDGRWDGIYRRAAE